jgi:hypothetical protein
MSYSKPGVDLGLAISGATLAPGKTRTCVEIAAFAGCSKQNIEQLEKRALKKLRHHIFYKHPTLRDSLSAMLSNSPLQ